MKYEFEGKSLNIPDKDLENLETNLGITRDEAIQCWLEDNDYTVSEEAQELTEKAKKNIKRYEKSDKARKKTTKERKVDEEKATLLNILTTALVGAGIQTAARNEADCSFTYSGSSYTVKLVKHRPPK